MKKIIYIIILVFVFSAFLGAADFSAEKGMEKWTEKTKSEIGQILDDVIKTRKSVRAFLKDSRELAGECAYLLGCDDKEVDIYLALSYEDYNSDIIVKTLEKPKIISYEEAKKKPLLEAGYISYEFGKNDTVNVVFSSLTGEGAEENFYFPVLVDKDGNIVKKQEIIDGLIAIGGNTELKCGVLFMEIIDDFVKNRLRIDFPYSRWYNEGLKYKIASLLLEEHKHPSFKAFSECFAVSEESRSLRNNVNLWDFVQQNLIISSQFDQKTDTANIHYSCELMDKMFDKIGREGLHKINMEMKYSELMTNEELCGTIKKLTGFDALGLLYQYTPESVVKITDIKKITELEKNCEKLMAEKRYKDAISVFETVLLADPYRLNSRLNAARCYREEGDIINSDKHIFLAANAMPPGKTNISLYGEQNEKFLIILGKYLFMSESFNDAQSMLEAAYEKDKSPDIKQILDSIALTKENIKKELYGGK